MRAGSVGGGVRVATLAVAGAMLGAALALSLSASPAAFAATESPSHPRAPGAQSSTAKSTPSRATPSRSASTPSTPVTSPQGRGGTPRSAQRRSAPADQVVLSGRVDVPRGRAVGQIVVVHGSATVEGVAIGDVVVVSGRIVVSGQVSGDVVSLGGPVLLGPSAQVRGDVISREAVVVRKGAQVQGTIRQSVPFSFRGIADVLGPVATWLAVTASLLVLGLILLWLFPRANASVVAAWNRRPLASVAWGLALLIGVPMLCLAAMLTLLLLPLGVVAALGFIVLLFVGSAWAASILGAHVVPTRGRVASFVVGLVILRIVALVPYVGGAVAVLAAAFGVGGATVAAWSARGRRGKHRVGGAVVDRTMPVPVTSEVREHVPVGVGADAGERQSSIETGADDALFGFDADEEEGMGAPDADDLTPAVPDRAAVEAPTGAPSVAADDGREPVDRSISDAAAASDAMLPPDDALDAEPPLFDDLEVHLPPPVLAPAEGADGEPDRAVENSEPTPPA